MEIPGATSGIFRVPPATSTAANGQWQPGQLLQATVTGNDLGRTLLAIGNRQVVAETSLALQKGQQLTLQVRSLGNQPLLQVISRLGGSELTATVRMLLPQQGSPTPLLASLTRLVRATGTTVPANVTELGRSLLRQLPQAVNLSTPRGLKQAMANSGLFMERNLLQATGQSPSAITFNSDYKANLLRLVEVVRNWPGTPHSAAPVTRQANSGNTSGTGQAAAVPAASDDEPEWTPQQVRQLVRAGIHPAPTTRPAPGSPQTGKAPDPATPNTPTTTAAGTTGTPQTLTSSSTPPPFRGVIPVPQPPLQPDLDLPDPDQLRSDFLRQLEAALSRLQLQQLATVPREGERGLIEWLLDLPVRRGEDIDLWSMRWYRDDKSGSRGAPEAGNWSVQMAFDLPGLGPMQALVQLQGERVTTRFWAQQEQTRPLLRANLGGLRHALQAVGLEVGELDCHAGSIPTPKTEPGKPFLQEKA